MPALSIHCRHDGVSASAGVPTEKNEDGDAACSLWPAGSLFCDGATVSPGSVEGGLVAAAGADFESVTGGEGLVDGGAAFRAGTSARAEVTENSSNKVPSRMLKMVVYSTRPPQARQDAPLPEQGRR